MKRQFRMFAAVAAMVLGFAAPALASDWLRNGTALTEQNAPGTAWVLTVTVSGTELSVTKVTTQGANTELDFSGAITDATGTDYMIVSLDGFAGKPITKLVFPTGIRTTKRDAFQGCTSLKTVEPLIPDTITEFGQRTFAGCTALEGDVVFPANTITSPYQWANGTWGWFNGSQITSCDMSAATMTEIVKYSFANCPKLKWVKLPQGLTTVSEYAFYNSVAVEQIEPFLPDTVTEIKQQVFANCKALSIPFTLSGTDAVSLTSDYNGGRMFNGAAVPSADITAPLEVLGTLSGTTPYGSVFYGAASMGEICLPTALKTVRKLNFSGCKVLTNLVFRSAYPTELDLTSFSGLTDYKVRLYIPRFDSSWEAVTAGTSFAPMDDTLTAKFRQSYPDDAVLPLGLWTIVTKNEQNQSVTIHVWVNDIYPWAESNAVHVDGSPFLADGTDEKVTPGYGLYTDVANGESRTFTAPALGEFGGGTYRCAGYILTYETGFATREFSDPIVSTDLSCTIDQTDDRVWRLTWQWAANGFTLDTTPFVPAQGSVTRDPEPVGGVYAPDTEVTVTAIPADGCRFVRWTGDVPEGQEKNTSVTLTMDAAKVCRPVFAGPWTFNGSNQITDGNWTLTVKNASGELSVSGLVSASDMTMLDLTMPISDAAGNAYTVVSVGGFTGKGVRSLALPSTLRRIENQAFYNCTALESVTPLLPASLVYLGQGCFNGCTSLGGDVTFPANTIESPYSWLSVGNAYGWFRASRITSCDMSAATVTAIRAYSFSECKQLEWVKLPQGLATIEQVAFSDAIALTTVSPLFPASVTEVGAKAFYNCKLLEGDVVFPKTDGIVTFLQDGNVGASNFQGCEKIVSFSLLADFYYKYNSNEPVRGRLGQNFLSGCKALKSVTISEVASDLSTSTGIFSQSPALREIVFLGETAPSIPSGGLFPNVPDCQAIVKIPSLTDSWAEFGAKWFSDPTADERAAYAALPGAVGRPKKIWNDAAKRRLFVRYLRTEGFLLIMR